MNTPRVKLFDMVLALSSAMDLVAPELYNHHQQVAYLSYRIAETMGFSADERQRVFLAAMLHDIGSLTASERITIMQEETSEHFAHAFRGGALVQKYRHFMPLSGIIKYHHTPWRDRETGAFEGEQIPVLSHVLHVADRVCVMRDPSKPVLVQLPALMEIIRADSGTIYMPQAVTALEEMSDREFIWLELMDKEPIRFIQQEVSIALPKLSITQLLQVSKIFSHVIDFRSRFTATHSVGVANTAHMLGRLCGFSETENMMLLIAGYLHDLGKLAIDNAILEKNGALTDEELRIVKSHSYYTYRLLSMVEGLETINEWASFHHEKLDGSGYPFHLKGENISLGARIMAVADVFTAISEKRPYRAPMEKARVIQVLTDMAEAKALCAHVVGVLLAHYDQVAKIREESEEKARIEYEAFTRTVEMMLKDKKPKMVSAAKRAG